QIRGAAAADRPDVRDVRPAGRVPVQLISCALALLCGAGCAGVGASAERGLAIEHEHFVAPAQLLRVQWHRQLVENRAFFAYHPQEFATAAVSDDGETVFIGSSAKIFYALRRSDGAELWKQQMNGGLSSEPLYLPAGQAGPDALILFG